MDQKKNFVRRVVKSVIKKAWFDELPVSKEKVESPPDVYGGAPGRLSEPYARTGSAQKHEQEKTAEYEAEESRVRSAFASLRAEHPEEIQEILEARRAKHNEPHEQETEYDKEAKKLERNITRDENRAKRVKAAREQAAIEGRGDLQHHVEADDIEHMSREEAAEHSKRLSRKGPNIKDSDVDFTVDIPEESDDAEHEVSKLEDVKWVEHSTHAPTDPTPKNASVKQSIMDHLELEHGKGSPEAAQKFDEAMKHIAPHFGEKHPEGTRTFYNAKYPNHRLVWTPVVHVGVENGEKQYLYHGAIQKFMPHKETKNTGTWGHVASPFAIKNNMVDEVHKNVNLKHTGVLRQWSQELGKQYLSALGGKSFEIEGPGKNLPPAKTKEEHEQRMKKYGVNYIGSIPSKQIKEAFGLHSEYAQRVAFGSESQKIGHTRNKEIIASKMSGVAPSKSKIESDVTELAKRHYSVIMGLRHHAQYFHDLMVNKKKSAIDPNKEFSTAAREKYWVKEVAQLPEKEVRSIEQRNIRGPEQSNKSMELDNDLKKAVEKVIQKLFKADDKGPGEKLSNVKVKRLKPGPSEPKPEDDKSGDLDPDIRDSATFLASIDAAARQMGPPLMGRPFKRRVLRHTAAGRAYAKKNPHDMPLLSSNPNPAHVEVVTRKLGSDKKVKRAYLESLPGGSRKFGPTKVGNLTLYGLTGGRSSQGETPFERYAIERHPTWQPGRQSQSTIEATEAMAEKKRSAGAKEKEKMSRISGSISPSEMVSVPRSFGGQEAEDDTHEEAIAQPHDIRVQEGTMGTAHEMSAGKEDYLRSIGAIESHDPEDASSGFGHSAPINPDYGLDEYQRTAEMRASLHNVASHIRNKKKAAGLEPEVTPKDIENHIQNIANKELEEHKQHLDKHIHKISVALGLKKPSKTDSPFVMPDYYSSAPSFMKEAVDKRFKESKEIDSVIREHHALNVPEERRSEESVKVGEARKQKTYASKELSFLHGIHEGRITHLEDKETGKKVRISTKVRQEAGEQLKVHYRKHLERHLERLIEERNKPNAQLQALISGGKLLSKVGKLAHGEIVDMGAHKEPIGGQTPGGASQSATHSGGEFDAKQYIGNVPKSTQKGFTEYGKIDNLLCKAIVYGQDISKEMLKICVKDNLLKALTTASSDYSGGYSGRGIMTESLDKKPKIMGFHSRQCDVCGTETPHFRKICLKCQLTRDFDPPNVEQMEKEKTASILRSFIMSSLKKGLTNTDNIIQIFEEKVYPILKKGLWDISPAGHTQSGKPIYMTDNDDSFKERHAGFTPEDHVDAFNFYNSKTSEHFYDHAMRHYHAAGGDKRFDSGFNTKDANEKMEVEQKPPRDKE